MTQKEFIYWLEGFMEGRKESLELHHSGYDIIEIIQEKMKQIDNVSCCSYCQNIQGYTTTIT